MPKSDDFQPTQFRGDFNPEDFGVSDDNEEEAARAPLLPSSSPGSSSSSAASPNHDLHLPPAPITHAPQSTAQSRHKPLLDYFAYVAVIFNSDYCLTDPFDSQINSAVVAF